MGKTIIPFGEWAPDVCQLDSQLTAIAENVYPGPNSYTPIPALGAISTAALLDPCLGLAFARTVSGAWVIFAGTANNLYKYASGSWTDVTRIVGGDYGVATGHAWSFTQWGTYLIAVNINDNPQVINIDSGTEFEDLAGSPPKAKHVTVVGPHVVLSGLASNERMLQWSGVEDHESWTVGTGLSDEQEFPEGGPIIGVAGGENGYVVQDRAIRMMQHLPGDIDTIFTFTRIEDKKGCISQQGFVTVNQTVFFVGEDGFFSIGSGGLSPIGANRINEWFRDNCDLARRSYIRAFAVADKPRVAWFFHSNPTSTNYDRIIFYDWSLNRWSYAIVSAQYYATLASVGMTLEDLNAFGTLDSLEVSLDSAVWAGGRPFIGAINADGELAALNGAPLAATFDTVERHLSPGSRSFVSEVYPLIDADGLTVAPGTRERLQNSVAWGSAASLEITGSCSMLSSGRLHRFRIAIPAGTVWANAQGVVAEVQPDGEV